MGGLPYVLEQHRGESWGLGASKQLWIESQGKRSVRRSLIAQKSTETPQRLSTNPSVEFPTVSGRRVLVCKVSRLARPEHSRTGDCCKRQQHPPVQSRVFSRNTRSCHATVSTHRMGLRVSADGHESRRREWRYRPYGAEERLRWIEDVVIVYDNLGR